MFGFTSVFLNGETHEVGNEKTNFGSLVADANSGGTTVINGFDPGQDRLALLGHDAGEATRAPATAQIADGSTTLTLVDNTRITFAGVSNLTSSAFI